VTQYTFIFLLESSQYLFVCVKGWVEAAVGKEPKF
jgi:hypothetical protein